MSQVKEQPDPEILCFKGLPENKRSCPACEKLNKCLMGYKILFGVTGAWTTKANLKCIDGSLDGCHSCDICDSLNKCNLGQRIQFGNDSLTVKVLELGFLPSKLEHYTISELNEIRDALRKQNNASPPSSSQAQYFNANAVDSWNRETQSWSRKTVENRLGEDYPDLPIPKGLQAVWDPKLKEWRRTKEE